MSFRLKPLYFERDGPVCTRSASSFCRNPLNFCTHVVWVKWWYHAKFQPFLSSGCSPFQFQGHLAENKSWNAWKISNEVSKGWNFSMCLWMLHVLDAKNVLSWNKLRKMKCLCNRWVLKASLHTNEWKTTIKKYRKFSHTLCRVTPIWVEHKLRFNPK